MKAQCGQWVGHILSLEIFWLHVLMIERWVLFLFLFFTVKRYSCNISLHILHTVLYTFPLVLTRRICLTIIIVCAMISFILITLMFGLGVIMLGEMIYLSYLSLLQVKGYNRIAMFETAYQINNIYVYCSGYFMERNK